MDNIKTIIQEIPTLTVSPAATPGPITPPPLPGTSPSPPCPDCAGLGFLRYDAPPGHPKFGKLEPCPHPSHQAERLERLARLSELQPAEMARCLADIRPVNGNQAMLSAAAEMLANPRGWLWIWGGPGNAKSEVLIALVNELNQNGHGPAVYTKFGKLVDYMRDAFDERKRRADSPDIDLGYIARFNRLKAVKVLAIDEMDKVRETPFLNDFRFDFLDDRYRQGIAGQTVTLFAGNSDPSELPDPIWDRVRDGRFKIVENKAPSARPYMRK